MPRFPEAKYTAVGAFVFLRFFCPAIVAPDVEGLVNTTPSKEMRRGLLLIAKVIQNLANNVLFGAKEPFMFPLNDFLTQNIYRVTTFLREISVRVPSACLSPPHPLPPTIGSLQHCLPGLTTRRSRLSRSARQGLEASRLTSAPVSRCTGSCMTTGTT
jgi:hypothetical protein